MSRSSKGFADFFPTAPSVVAQKRSKAAQTRKRPKSPCVNEESLAQASLASHASSEREHEPAAKVNGTSHGFNRSQNNSTMSEEIETGPGDLLNGVGSASSTSTSSSVFSTSYNSRNNASKNGLASSTSLTPITNIDSSPPNNNHGSPERKDILNHSMHQTSQRHFSQPEAIESAGTSKQSCGLSSGPRCARPAMGVVKGIKVVYDPDLVPSKERKSKKVQYEPFGERVCLPLNEVPLVIIASVS